MKIRYADARANLNVLEKEFFCQQVKNNEFEGHIAILAIKRVKNKSMIPRENRADDCILDDGYYWLEVYPTNQHVAITAMYNAQLELVEWYMDIVKKNGIEDHVPYIQDLYLDVVVTAFGEVIELDRDELEDAYTSGDITADECELAKKMGEKLMIKYQEKAEREKLKVFTDHWLQDSMKKMIAK